MPEHETWLRRAVRSVIKTAAVLATLVGIMILIWSYQRSLTGRMETGLFDYRPRLSFDRTSPEGVTYQVNNSTASFRFDVKEDREHGRRLFPDYRSALRYAQEQDLPLMPSVHLVLGKLKQFDDGFLAALEPALQKGEVISKQRALRILLDRLLDGYESAQTEERPAMARASAHVAAALELGGVSRRLPPAVRSLADRMSSDFEADPAQSRPAGFWAESDELARWFRQDRFLQAGFPSRNPPPEVQVLIQTIASDQELARAFDRINRIEARLTNPGDDAGFALISYAQSKEFSLLSREFPDRTDEPTMAIIIDAVRKGRLSLAPRPESGWYDHQWYALETLLLPEKAQEAKKIKLTTAYKKRLELAFASSLTKARETHIKRLPEVAGCFSDPPKKVKIDLAPWFSAEPLATVYLRRARGYRLVREWLHDLAGPDFMKGLHRSGDAGTEDLDGELERMMMLCYGLYELTIMEVGLDPVYEDGEMSESAAQAARDEAKQWLASLDSDPDLARDARVAVLITTRPDRYWGAAGIRLQRVKYTYVEKPNFSKNVDPTLVPGYYYLPTDVFVEFPGLAGGQFTHAEFRNLCDKQDDEESLRRALHAVKPKSSRDWLGRSLLVFFALLLTASTLAGAIWLRKNRESPRVRKAWLWSRVAMAVSFLVLIAVLVYSPYWRARILIRWFASINVDTGLMYENHFIYRLHNTKDLPQIRAIVDLLDHPKDQVRYLAARYLDVATLYNTRRPDILGDYYPVYKRALDRASDDENSEVAARAMVSLARCADPKDIKYFIQKYLDGADNDLMRVWSLECISILGREPELKDALNRELTETIRERRLPFSVRLDLVERLPNPESLEEEYKYLLREAESDEKKALAASALAIHGFAKTPQGLPRSNDWFRTFGLQARGLLDSGSLPDLMAALEKGDQQKQAEVLVNSLAPYLKSPGREPRYVLYLIDLIVSKNSCCADSLIRNAPLDDPQLCGRVIELIVKDMGVSLAEDSPLRKCASPRP